MCCAMLQIYGVARDLMKGHSQTPACWLCFASDTLCDYSYNINRIHVM
jgi:hypothetical protein